MLLNALNYRSHNELYVQRFSVNLKPYIKYAVKVFNHYLLTQWATYYLGGRLVFTSLRRRCCHSFV